MHKKNDKYIRIMNCAYVHTVIIWVIKTNRVVKND